MSTEATPSSSLRSPRNSLNLPAASACCLTHIGEFLLASELRTTVSAWSLYGMPGPSCASQGRAIVRRMSHENTGIKSFFSRYEAANTTFDVEQIAGCYADVFMFGGPAGVQSVKKEDFL